MKGEINQMENFIFDSVMEKLSQEENEKFSKLNQEAKKAIETLRSNMTEYTKQCKKIDAFIKSHPGCNTYDEENKEEEKVYIKVCQMVDKAHKHLEDFTRVYFKIRDAYKQTKMSDTLMSSIMISILIASIGIISLPFTKKAGAVMGGGGIVSAIISGKLLSVERDRSYKKWKKKLEEWMKSNPDNYYKVLEETNDIVENLYDEFSKKYGDWMP